MEGEAHEAIYCFKRTGPILLPQRGPKIIEYHIKILYRALLHLDEWCIALLTFK
jgi:hypothetical protein